MTQLKHEAIIDIIALHTEDTL